MEAAVRFSQKSLPGQDDQHYLKVDVAGRILQIYNIKGRRNGVLQQEQVYASPKLSPFRAFDWHPSQDALIAVGHTGGEASLVNLSEHASSVSFQVRSQRSCNAVGLNTENLIAIGLDKVRNDFCLSIYDITQKGGSQGSARGHDPLRRLAPGEPISSLRFFHDEPQLLAAGVKGQFIRVYDLREHHSAPALQFHTRCVNNIALNTQDENYFASVLPTNVPAVTIWDRRMISRTSVANVGFGGSTQNNQHPDSSAELKNIVDSEGTIWGLRFSKTHRGHLGVLSSTGQIRIVNIATIPSNEDSIDPKAPVDSWEKQSPQNLCLVGAYNFDNAWTERPRKQELQRLVSFDYTTACSKNGQPKIVTLTGNGHVDLVSLPADNIGVRCRAVQRYHTAAPVPRAELAEDETASATEKRQSEKSNLILLAKRVQTGYLLDATVNLAAVADDPNLCSLWTWVQHAQSLMTDGHLVCDGIDLSYLGVYSLWMESLEPRHRSADKAFHSNSEIGSTLRNLAKKLHLEFKGAATEYPHNRALSLFVLGLPWTTAAIEQQTQLLIAQGEHSKAAALALLSGETKLATKLLRLQGSQNTHKTLAIALIGAKHGRTPEDGEEWLDIVNAVAEHLTDPYSKAILSYVKSGAWDDVIGQTDLPLEYRLTAALRHFDDSKLTKYLSDLKAHVVSSGDLGGIAFTGLGTPESIALLQSYARRSNDIQSATLAMSFAAVSDRFLPPASAELRLVQSFRECYKRQLLQSGLAMHKAMYTVKLADLLRKHEPATRPKDSIRLTCKHCSGSVAVFGHEQQESATSVTWKETEKNPLMPEKAAIIGTICPKCGRQLQNCGVCELPLGTGDETYAKWYKPKMDLSASMAETTVTAIGPESQTSHKPSASELGEAVEVVDEEALKREEMKKRDELMRRHITVCVMCTHMFHSDHARQWFQGGKKTRKVCPVPHCKCMCMAGVGSVG